ncbi:MAG: putative lipopolysaccharide heptosyltransferase III [Sterolibacterium sp.]
MLADAIPLDQMQRVLVVKLRHHGDVLLTSPLFSALKAAVPGITIDALVYADTAEMLTLHPDIAEVHTIDRHWKKLGPLAQLRAELGLLGRLRSRRYDLVIHLTEHWRGAWLARLLGVRWAVTYRVPGRNRFWRASFSHQIPRAAAGKRHTVEAHLDALRRIGIQPDAAQRQLRLVAGAAADAHIDRLLAGRQLAGRGFIHIHPTSRWLFKGWTTAGWVGLIDALQAEGWPVVLSAAADGREQALVDAIMAELAKPAISLAGQLSLKQLAALTDRAVLFIGVDSAPMHIAAAMSTPTVVLFGPSGEHEWGPWNPCRPETFRVIASHHHTCRPCGLDGCGGGKVSDCLVSLSVAQVLAAAHGLLPASAE